MKGFLDIGGQRGFVDVAVVPERDFEQRVGIGSAEEYAAVVQYLLQYDSRMIETICQSNLGLTMPTNLVFGPLSRERGDLLIDLAPGSTHKRHWCISPCDGPGMRCHIALAGYLPGALHTASPRISVAG